MKKPSDNNQSNLETQSVVKPFEFRDVPSTVGESRHRSSTVDQPGPYDSRGEMTRAVEEIDDIIRFGDPSGGVPEHFLAAVYEPQLRPQLPQKSQEMPRVDFLAHARLHMIDQLREKLGDQADTVFERRREKKTDLEGLIDSLEAPVVMGSPEMAAISRAVRLQTRDLIQDEMKKLRDRIRNESLKSKLQIYKQRLEYLEKITEVKYHDVQPLGQGGMGKVYKARTESNHDVVLKVVDEYDQTVALRSLREMNALLRLSDVDDVLTGFHIRRLGPEGIDGIENSENALVIETELVDGVNLRQLLSDWNSSIAFLERQTRSKEVLSKDEWMTRARSLLVFEPTMIDEFLNKPLSKGTPPLSDREADELIPLQDAETLLRRLKRYRRLRSVRYAKKTAVALQKAHTRGLIHRDIKPENLMVSDQAPYKVIDWGLVKDLSQTPRVMIHDISQLDDPNVDVFTSQEGTTLGTPSYMSFSQFAGEKVEAHFDIWSTGTTLYHLLMGRLPFRGEGVIDIINNIRDADRMRMKEEIAAQHDPLIADIVTKTLHRDKQYSFQSMADLAEALEIYEAVTTTEQFRDYITQRAQKWAAENPNEQMTEQDLRHEKRLQKLDISRKSDNIDSLVRNVHHMVRIMGKRLQQRGV